MTLPTKKSKNKKPPVRTCAGCRTPKEKKELIRIVRRPDGSVVMDPTGKENGRGTYLCRDVSCLMKARKSRSIERSLSAEISDEVYQELERELLN